MANYTISRFFLSKPKTLKSLSSSTRTFSSISSLSKTPSLSSSPSNSLLHCLRPLTAVSFVQRFDGPSVRALSSRAASSSLNDPNPNWNNRPPKETILLDGCDFEHWLVVMEKPEGDPTRDEIIDSYVKTLAMVVGSEEEARMKIYSVSTRCYFAFGALVPEELSHKIKELPRVRWVLPDSYLDVKNKDYGGEPFIDGKAVPYDPKYHEEWIRNNARANERNRRNDRPRNSDRSRNFDRRRENMQNRDFQNREMPPPANQSMQPSPNMGGMPPHMSPNNMGGMPPHMNSNNMGQMPPNVAPNMGGMPSNMGPNMGGMQQGPNVGGMQQGGNMGGMQPNNFGPRPPMPPNQGWSGNMQNYQNNPSQGGPPNYPNYSSNSPNQGGTAYQGATPNYPNNHTPNRDGGNMPGGNY